MTPDPMEKIKLIKEAVGIPCANCSSCAHLYHEGDGFEYNGTWEACGLELPVSNLKSFPFKKDMKCWEPSFWSSKFLDDLDDLDGAGVEIDAAFLKYKEVLASVESKEESTL